ncbi:PXA domain-containing protein, variant 2 [Balamuthia mandrillaris]
MEGESGGAGGGGGAGSNCLNTHHTKQQQQQTQQQRWHGGGGAHVNSFPMMMSSGGQQQQPPCPCCHVQQFSGGEGGEPSRGFTFYVRPHGVDGIEVSFILPHYNNNRIFQSTEPHHHQLQQQQQQPQTTTTKRGGAAGSVGKESGGGGGGRDKRKRKKEKTEDGAFNAGTTATVEEQEQQEETSKEGGGGGKENNAKEGSSFWFFKKVKETTASDKDHNKGDREKEKGDTHKERDKDHQQNQHTKERDNEQRENVAATTKEKTQDRGQRDGRAERERERESFVLLVKCPQLREWGNYYSELVVNKEKDRSSLARFKKLIANEFEIPEERIYKLVKLPNHVVLLRDRHLQRLRRMDRIEVLLIPKKSGGGGSGGSGAANPSASTSSSFETLPPLLPFYNIQQQDCGVADGSVVVGSLDGTNSTTTAAPSEMMHSSPQRQTLSPRHHLSAVATLLSSPSITSSFASASSIPGVSASSSAASSSSPSSSATPFLVPVQLSAASAATTSTSTSTPPTTTSTTDNEYTMDSEVERLNDNHLFRLLSSQPKKKVKRAKKATAGQRQALENGESNYGEQNVGAEEIDQQQEGGTAPNDATVVYEENEDKRIRQHILLGQKIHVLALQPGQCTIGSVPVESKKQAVNKVVGNQAKVEAHLQRKRIPVVLGPPNSIVRPKHLNFPLPSTMVISPSSSAAAAAAAATVPSSPSLTRHQVFAAACASPVSLSSDLIQNPVNTVITISPSVYYPSSASETDEQTEEGQQQQSGGTMTERDENTEEIPSQQPVLHMIDHHHIARAVWESKLPLKEKSVYFKVVADLSHLSVPQFWEEMKKRNWVYLMRNGEGPLSPEDLPLSVADMVDDPFRSLAWALRGLQSSPLPFLALSS